jgi:2-polyprenyl-3-methyl-5-hydroxy-6-metoxy-1,4-benzoquinol methylase
MDTPYDLSLAERVLADGNHPVGLALSLVPDGSRVLELGCATGYVTRLLSHHKGCRVSGVELMPRAAEQARPFCQTLIVGDLEDPSVMGQAAGTYDVILAGDVLEHLRHPDRLLLALRPWLAPGGAWVISVPNVAHWSVRKELLLGRFNYTARGIMDATHLRWFTRQTLRDLLERCGYKVTRQSAVYTLPRQDSLGLQGLARRLQAAGWAPGFFGYQLVARAQPQEAAQAARP